MLTNFVVWLNVAANSLANILLAPVAWLPGWLSATVIATVTGLLMLLVFKHTSNQRAIQRTRNQIKANLLALSLFKDDLRVGLRTQARLLRRAGQLIALSLVPMLVMLVPMCLMLGQLAVWYQARPLSTGEEAVVTVRLQQDNPASVNSIQLAPADSVVVVAGPVRVPRQSFVCWNIRATEPGRHALRFSVDNQTYSKELSVGNGFMPVSAKRPGWSWGEALLYPRERPFPDSSLVKSIEIAYPQRSSWTSGSNSWLLYWFGMSMIAAFAARRCCGCMCDPVLRVDPMALASEIIVVSSLPRSGTSLMMQMLVRGGIPAVTDEMRTPDVDNPRGYYEYERVKKTKDDPSWIPSARGKVVKMVSSLLYDLPPSETYRVIFMRRDIDEVLESQEKMLQRLGKPAAPRDQIRSAFAVHLERLFRWLPQQSHLRFLEVNYNDLVRTPEAEVDRISNFLDAGPVVSDMLKAVDPSLYRNRRVALSRKGAG